MIQYYLGFPKFGEEFKQLVLGSTKDLIYGAEINSEEHPNFLELAQKIGKMDKRGILQS